MIFKTIQKALQRNASTILIWTGIFGFGVSCVATAKAYTECKELVKKKKEELKVDKLPVKEVVKTCWKPCVLPLLTFSTSTICVLGSRNIILKEKAALAALYKATETALTEFKNETKREVGEETFRKIQSEAAANKAAANPDPIIYKELPIDETLYYDDTYGGYFYSTDVKINKAFENARKKLNSAFDNTLLASELYYDLHNGETMTVGENLEYRAEDYIHRDLDVIYGDYWKIAPNGRRAVPIFYDMGKLHEK